MNKVFALISLGVLFFVAVDSFPMVEIFKGSIIKLVRREVESENDSSLSQGNSSTVCNTTNCINSTSNKTSNLNLTNSLNITGTPLNLTFVCKENTTGITVQCNGTTLNLTKHCEDMNNGNISVIYCVNETYVSYNMSLSANATSLNTTLITLNQTLGNASINATGPNVTFINETVNGTVDLSATISPSQTFSVSVTSTLSVSPSMSSVTSRSSLHDSASFAQLSTSSSIKPSSTSVATESRSLVATLTVAVTGHSTTQSTTAEAITQKTTAKPTTPQTTTVEATTTQATTTRPTTPQTTPAKTETENTTPVSTPAKAETEHADKLTPATMESPFNSAKNIKFFYVNVLIPVGAGVCGALLIAFSVILFKCCRRRKLKKVRYFGKPRKGYTQNKMDHMNLLSASSDEE